MSQSDNEKATGDGAAASSGGALAKLRYYVLAVGLELYDFVYGLFFASTKKDQEDEDERRRATKRRS